MNLGQSQIFLQNPWEFVPDLRVSKMGNKKFKTFRNDLTDERKRIVLTSKLTLIHGDRVENCDGAKKAPQQ